MLFWAHLIFLPLCRELETCTPKGGSMEKCRQPQPRLRFQTREKERSFCVLQTRACPTLPSVASIQLKVGGFVLFVFFFSIRSLGYIHHMHIKHPIESSTFSMSCEDIDMAGMTEEQILSLRTEYTTLLALVNGVKGSKFFLVTCTLKR